MGNKNTNNPLPIGQYRLSGEQAYNNMCLYASACVKFSPDGWFLAFIDGNGFGKFNDKDDQFGDEAMENFYHKLI